MAAETTFDIGFGTKFDPANLEEGLSKALARAEKETENSAAKQVAAVAKGALEEVKAVKAAENKKIEERKKSTQEQIELIRAMPDLAEAQKKRKIKAAEKAGREEVANLEGNLRNRLRLIQESVTDEVNLINEGAELKSRIDAVYESAQKEIEIRRKAASAGIEERKKAAEEEIAAIKARTDLSEAEKKKQVEAVREAERQKTEAVKSGLQDQLAKVKASTDARVKIIRDGARRERREIENGNRNNLRGIKDFGKGASQAMGGIGASMKKLAMGPVGIGAAVVLAGKQVKRFLNQTAAAWRVEEQAQIALAAAARNNPYLNERGVHQLRQFASEMQRLTGIDNVQVMGAQTRLAALGRSQQEIEQIVRTAADIAATGLMSYDQAVDELSQSFSGFTRRLERMFPELKSLTEEAKMAGGAVSLIAENVSGMAEQALRSGAGSVIAYRNAIESLRRSIGQDWETATRGFRVALTEYINRIVQAREESAELRNLMRALRQEGEISAASQHRQSELVLNNMERERERLERLAERHFMTNLAEDVLRNYNPLLGMYHVYRGLYRIWRGESFFTPSSAGAERQLEALNQQMESQRELEAASRERLELEEAIERAQTSAARAMDAAIDEGSERAMAAAMRAMEAAERAEAQATSAAAQTQAQAAAAEARYIERLQEIAKIRAENLESLEAEIRQIKLRAEIEGRGPDSAEAQQQILQARISAHKALVAEIGNYAEQEQETMRQLQAEFLRQQIAAGQRLQDENMRHLETRRREILAIAELEGRVADDTRTQSELLDAQVNAYQNQLRILRDLIDGAREEETARRAALEAQWMQYAQRKVSARAERESLEEAIRLQGELRARVERMSESARVSIDDRQFRTELDRLETLRLDAARRGAEQEREIIRQIYGFKAARGKDAIREELAFLERELESAGQMLSAAMGTPREGAIRSEIADLESMIGALSMSNVIDGIEKADRLFEQMLANVDGPNARARATEIAALRLELLDSEMERRRELGEEAESLALERARREAAIQQQAADKIREAYRRMLADLNGYFDKFLDSIQSMANSVATIWTNSIDRQTQEKLRANDAMEQSDEERAMKEREILKRAAYERYKAELFAWAANVTFATAQAGLAVLNAFTSGLQAPWPATMAVAALQKGLAVAAGATQVAAVISAKPNPPRFHAGGQVPGRAGQEVPAILQAGESVFTQAQFRNMQSAFASLAGMAYRPAAQAPSITVNNNMGREARVSQNIDPSGVTFTIDQVVRDGIAKGRYDGAFDRRDANRGGRGVATF